MRTHREFMLINLMIFLEENLPKKEYRPYFFKAKSEGIEEFITNCKNFGFTVKIGEVTGAVGAINWTEDVAKKFVVFGKLEGW